MPAVVAEGQVALRQPGNATALMVAPNPRQKARKLEIRHLRQEWVVDTLLSLRPHLALTPLDTSARHRLATAYPYGFPAEASLLQPGEGPTTNLPNGLGWAALGWLITAAALSVGAPFWFEILNRFINVRNMGVRPPSSLPNPAKDPS